MHHHMNNRHNNTQFDLLEQKEKHKNYTDGHNDYHGENKLIEKLVLWIFIGLFITFFIRIVFFS